MPFPSRPGNQFVNSADTVCTSVVRGSIKFTRRSLEQRAIRKASVGLPVEGIKRLEIPFSTCCWCEFENNTGSIKAARSRGAIQQSMAQQHSSSRTAGSVRAACKGVNDLKSPTPGVWMDFVNRAYAVCATGGSHAIHISAPIDSDSRARARSIIAASERMNDGLRPRAA